MGLLDENGLVLVLLIHPRNDAQIMPLFSLGILYMIINNIKVVSIVKRTFCSVYIILCLRVCTFIRIIVEEALPA